MIQQYKPKVEPNYSPIDAFLRDEAYAQPHIKVLVRNSRLSLNQTVQLNPKETLVELKQYLSQTTPLYLFENYHFENNGKPLPQSSEICDAFVAEAEDAVLDVVLDMFDERTSKHHVRMVQQVIANPVLWAVVTYKQKDEKERFGRQSLASPQDPGYSVKGTVKPGLADVFVPAFESPFLSHIKQLSIKETLQFLNFSGYNPPPTSRKLQGDFFYLHLKTLDNQDFHITCNSRGFFINCSNIINFDPSPHPEYNKSYTNLLDLLQSLSLKFKETFHANAEQVVLTEVERLVITSHYRNQNIWISQKNRAEHRWNANRVEDNNLLLENSGIKDWNELLQAQHALPTNTVIERLNKTKMMIKVYNQFSATAIQGAKALVEGRMSPLNPLDDKLQHIYIHNSIFYSIAQETPYDYSQQKGMDATPTVSAITTDLRNLSTLLNLEIKDLHVLHMVLVEYRGFKIIAQCIIPGILTAEQLHCSQYGSIDDGKTIENNKEFQQLMIQVCEKLHLDSKVDFKDSNGSIKRIAGSIEVKGILGSDKRKYILDLLRLSPRDYNFLGPKYHTCVLRPELLSLYKSTSKEAQQYADLHLNANLETGIEFIPTSTTTRQQDHLRSIANFAKTYCVTQVIKALSSTQRRYLSDTKGVVKIMHSFGLNSRYLGEILKQTSKQQHPHVALVLERVIVVKSLKHLFRMALRESSPLHLSAVLCRLLNCIFGTRHHRRILQAQSSQVPLISSHADASEQIKKKKKKKYKQHKPTAQQLMIDELCSWTVKSNFEDISIKSSKYIEIKPTEAWSKVCEISRCRYFHELPVDYDEYRGSQQGFSKIATLRDLCLHIGLVLEKKNYNIFEAASGISSQLPFQTNNILELQAKAKHIQFSNREASYLIERADAHLSKFQVDEAIQLYNSAVQYMVGLYGGMNDEIAVVHHKIANVYFRFGHYAQAIMCERSSLDLLKQLYGEDHLLTIQSYSNLALFYFNQLEKDKAIHYLLKCIFLSHYAFGEVYPEIIVSLMHLSAVYQQCSQPQLAILCLVEALERTIKIYGRRHLNTAVCYNALAHLHFEVSDLRQTIQFQEMATEIYRELLRENDCRVVQNVLLLNKYKQMQANKRLTVTGSSAGALGPNAGVTGEGELKKMQLSREEKNLMASVNSGGRGTEGGGYQRNLLLKKLQMAKLNSRMGFKR